MVDQAQQLIHNVVQQGVKKDAVKVGAILEEYFEPVGLFTRPPGRTRRGTERLYRSR